MFLFVCPLFFLCGENGDILFNYGPGTQYPRVSGASSLFTGNLAYSVWRGAQGEGEVEDQSRGHRVRG